MNLTTRRAARRARILARALPSWEDRAATAAAAGLVDPQLSGDAVAAWRLLLSQAEEEDRLDALLDAAVVRAPDDARLRRLVRGRTGAPAGRWAVASLVILLLAVAGGLTLASSLGRAPGDPPPAQPEGAPADLAVLRAEEPRRDPAEAEEVEAEKVEEPAEPAPSPVLAEAAAARVQEAERAAVAHLCPEAPGGGTLGWVHAGLHPPGNAGDAWILPHAVNVRVAPPRADNGWSPRQPVVCVLPEGVTVRLDAAPVAVAGGAWWVPVAEGAGR